MRRNHAVKGARIAVRVRHAPGSSYLRADIIEPKLLEHGGRVLEIAGDAVLVEFRSAVAAVAWAVDTQRTLASTSWVTA